MKSNLGRRSTKNEEWKPLFEKGRRKKKSLLLHYDKHENNFPPIFSIKIIASLFISLYSSLSSILGETRQGFAAAASVIVVVGVLEIENAFFFVYSRLLRADEMEMKYSETSANIVRNIRFLIEFLILADASNEKSMTDPSNFLHKLLQKIEYRGRKFHRHRSIHYRFAFLLFCQLIVSLQEKYLLVIAAFSARCLLWNRRKGVSIGKYLKEKKSFFLGKGFKVRVEEEKTAAVGKCDREREEKESRCAVAERQRQKNDSEEEEKNKDSTGMMMYHFWAKEKLRESQGIHSVLR